MNENSDRHQIMNDPDFWMRLAFTFCGLLRESADKSLRGLWIDDFLPESVTDTKRGVDVEGTAWVGYGPRLMHPYRFIVSIPQKVLCRRRESFVIERFEIDEERHTLQAEIGHENPVA